MSQNEMIIPCLEGDLIPRETLYNKRILVLYTIMGIFQFLGIVFVCFPVARNVLRPQCCRQGRYDLKISKALFFDTLVFNELSFVSMEQVSPLFICIVNFISINMKLI